MVNGVAFLIVVVFVIGNLTLGSGRVSDNFNFKCGIAPNNSMFCSSPPEFKYDGAIYKQKQEIEGMDYSVMYQRERDQVALRKLQNRITAL